MLNNIFKLFNLLPGYKIHPKGGFICYLNYVTSHGEAKKDLFITLIIYSPCYSLQKISYL